MTKLLDFISRTPVLIFSFISMIVLGASFGLLTPQIGGPLLDMKMNGADAISRLNEMSPYHRKIHILITATLDSLYPLANFSFFAGFAARFAKSWRKYAVIPACIYVVADFVENGVQILALSGSENLLGLKDFLTPMKMYTLVAAAIIVIVFAILALIKWIVKPAKP